MIFRVIYKYLVLYFEGIIYATVSARDSQYKHFAFQAGELKLPNYLKFL